MPLLSRTPALLRAGGGRLIPAVSKRASVGMAGSHANHYFSPRAKRRRDDGFPFRLTPPTVAPGQFPGALRFVSLALHILPHKGERRRRYVSARKISGSHCFRKRISQQPCCQASATQLHEENLQRTASQDELAEPNYYSKRLETSSTRLFASHCRERIVASFFSWYSPEHRQAIFPAQPVLADSGHSL